MTAAAVWTWEDELGYCAGLCRTQGNADVPMASVASYLHTQMAGADLSHKLYLVPYFRDAMRAVQVDDWDRARTILLRGAGAERQELALEQRELSQLADQVS